MIKMNSFKEIDDYACWRPKTEMTSLFISNMIFMLCILLMTAGAVHSYKAVERELGTRIARKRRIWYILSLLIYTLYCTHQSCEATLRILELQ